MVPLSSLLSSMEAYTFSIMSQISGRVSALAPGLSGNIERLRATRMRVEMIFAWADGDSSTVILAGSMSQTCLVLSISNPLWYFWMTG